MLCVIRCSNIEHIQELDWMGSYCFSITLFYTVPQTVKQTDTAAS